MKARPREAWHAREESKYPVGEGELDLSKVEDAPLRKRLRKWSAAGELAPRFETVIRRTAWMLSTSDGSVVECALDRGAVRTPHGRRTVAL